ncbi:hypothetical protein CHS0354_019214 [Potamilus streckersoni]|uniref:Uncharacterized protein n=1 Tax=Potamilus streckersoni TaxID=2493646 RepID=A0AAE0SZK6_9BIVA|nr:hypothetical protein CHS0354_019214 [Potamilus streckersoni]
MQENSLTKTRNRFLLMTQIDCVSSSRRNITKSISTNKNNVNDKFHTVLNKAILRNPQDDTEKNKDIPNNKKQHP